MEILSIIITFLVIVGVLTLLFLWFNSKFTEKLKPFIDHQKDLKELLHKDDSKPELEEKEEPKKEIKEQLTGIKIDKNVQPYNIQIRNTTNEKKKAVIFGYNQFLLAQNFGSDKGLEITCNNTASYAELLNESALAPFAFNNIRLIAKNQSQFKNDLVKTMKNAKGFSATIPILLSEIDRRTNNRHQKHVLDIEHTVFVDSQMSLSLDIDPNELVTMIIFPTVQVSLNALGTDSLDNLNWDIINGENDIDEDFILSDVLIPELKVRDYATQPPSEEESDSMELNSDNLEEIKEQASADSLEKKIPPLTEHVEDMSPIPFEIQNHTETTQLFSGELYFKELSGLKVKFPKNINDQIRPANSSRIRIQATDGGSINQSIGKFGTKKEMSEGGRFTADNFLQSGILDVDYSSLEEGLDFNDFLIEIKPQANIILTYYPIID